MCANNVIGGFHHNSDLHVGSENNSELTLVNLFDEVDSGDLFRANERTESSSSPSVVFADEDLN